MHHFLPSCHRYRHGKLALLLIASLANTPLAAQTDPGEGVDTQVSPSANPSASSSVKASVASVPGAAERSLRKVYQPTALAFDEAASRLHDALSANCSEPSEAALQTTLAAYARAVARFAELELYRSGPMVADNRQNRLFYWPDKRRVGERQMRQLLADPAAGMLDVEAVADKSVALQGFPALERLLFSSARNERFTSRDGSPDCHVAAVIAGNVAAMAEALNAGWQDDAPQVQSLLQPTADAEFYRSETEVLRAIVTQILVGMDVILDRKLALLQGESQNLRRAPLWRSGQTLAMLAGNLDSIRALVIDSGLARATRLENELAFEFRTADGLLQKLQGLPALVDAQGQPTEDAASLLRALTAVVGGIRYTLNDRFVAALGVGAGFNSEDGD